MARSGGPFSRNREPHRALVKQALRGRPRPSAGSRVIIERSSARRPHHGGDGDVNLLWRRGPSVAATYVSSGRHLRARSRIGRPPVGPFPGPLLGDVPSPKGRAGRHRGGTCSAAHRPSDLLALWHEIYGMKGLLPETRLRASTRARLQPSQSGSEVADRATTMIGSAPVSAATGQSTHPAARCPGVRPPFPGWLSGITVMRRCHAGALAPIALSLSSLACGKGQASLRTPCAFVRCGPL